MGKRGRPPSPGEKVILSTQVTEDTRAALQRSIDRKAGLLQPGMSKPTLSAEVNTRLTRSLREAERLFDLFGDAPLYVLCRLLAQVMKAAGEESYFRDFPEQHSRLLIDREKLRVPISDWLNDAAAYSEAVAAAISLLERLRPDPPKHPRRHHPVPADYGKVLADALAGRFKWGEPESFISSLSPDDDEKGCQAVAKAVRRFRANSQRTLESGKARKVVAEAIRHSRERSKEHRVRNRKGGPI